MVGWGCDGLADFIEGRVKPAFGQCGGGAAIRGAVQVAAGHRFSLALLSNGSVRSWGMPAAPHAAALHRHASVQSAHCATPPPLQVRAWGMMDSGIQGGPALQPAARAVPAVLREAKAWNPVMAIGTSGHNAYGLLRNGTLVGWGPKYPAGGSAIVSDLLAFEVRDGLDEAVCCGMQHAACCPPRLSKK